VTLARVNSRLAARAGTRQVEVSLRADAAADAADRAVHTIWHEMVRSLYLPHHGTASDQIETLARAVPARLVHRLARDLSRAVQWGHRTARLNLLATVPRPLLLRAAVRKQLREDELRIDVADILFPPLSEEQIHRVVFSSGWQARLASATTIAGATPERLADVLRAGLTRGDAPADLARALLPVVDGVRSTARRIARTEALRVAAAAQMECHRQLGDLVVGHQIHATLDQHTRPAHAARNGTVYWIEPKPGQLGMDQCPHPPQEADGTTAYN
jgi:SPP1 gp7 family putative phage head morphogenesis protein